MEISEADQLLASAIQYLIQGDENDTALLLLFCDATITEWYGTNIDLALIGPRSVYDAFVVNGYDDDGRPVGYRSAVEQAFSAVAPPGKMFHELTVRARLVDNLDPNWRAELKEIAHGRGVHNQGVEIPGRNIIIWKGNIRLRSEPERRIAEALDATGVLFLPNCLARLTTGDDRVTKEPDFLICRDGKWGILEVDSSFHPRASIDHSRDRLFQAYRIRVIQRFDSQECMSDAPSVVQRFLTLLDKNG